MAISAVDRQETMIAAGEALAREALATGRPLRLRVTTGSMRPLLWPGDEVIVVQVLPEHLRRGDLVVRAPAEGVWIVHRLLAVRGEQVVTQGDSLLWPDPAWPAAELVGRVIAARRQGREIALDAWWSRPAGRLLALAGLAKRLVRRAFFVKPDR